MNDAKIIAGLNAIIAAELGPTEIEREAARNKRREQKRRWVAKKIAALKAQSAAAQVCQQQPAQGDGMSTPATYDEAMHKAEVAA